MNKTITRTLIWLIVIGWTVLIYFFSAQPAAKSSETSNAVSEVVAAIVYEHPTPQRVSELDETVRDAAHFSIYTFLGFFTCLAIRRTKLAKKALIVTLAACAIYALTDETHQLFVLGRSFQLQDLVLDFCGSALGMAACLLFARKKSRRIDTSSQINRKNDRKKSLL